MIAKILIVILGFAVFIGCIVEFVRAFDEERSKWR